MTPSNQTPSTALPAGFAAGVSFLGFLLLLLHGAKILVLDDKVLILFAICVLAWVLPRITKFKYGDLEVEIAAMKAEQERIVDALAEPPVAAVPDRFLLLSEGLLNVAETGTQTEATPSRKLLAVLAEGPYTFRTQSVLERRSGLTAASLSRELTALGESGQVVQVHGRAGQPLWGITAMGRATLT